MSFSTILSATPVVESISNSLDFKDVFRLMLSSKDVYSAFHSAFEQKDVDHYMNKYIPGFRELRHILQQTDSVMTGQAINDYRKVGRFRYTDVITINICIGNYNDDSEDLYARALPLYLFFNTLEAKEELEWSDKQKEYDDPIYDRLYDIHGCKVKTRVWQGWHFDMSFEVHKEFDPCTILTSLGTYILPYQESKMYTGPVKSKKILISEAQSTFIPALEYCNVSIDDNARKQNDHLLFQTMCYNRPS